MEYFMPIYRKLKKRKKNKQKNNTLLDSEKKGVVAW